MSMNIKIHTPRGSVSAPGAETRPGPRPATSSQLKTTGHFVSHAIPGPMGAPPMRGESSLRASETSACRPRRNDFPSMHNTMVSMQGEPSPRSSAVPSRDSYHRPRYADPQDYARESGNLETNGVYREPGVAGGLIPNPQDYDRESFQMDTAGGPAREYLQPGEHSARSTEHTIVQIIEEEGKAQADDGWLKWILMISGSLLLIVLAVGLAMYFCRSGSSAPELANQLAEAGEAFTFTAPGEWVYFTPETDSERKISFSENMVPHDPVQYVYGRAYESTSSTDVFDIYCIEGTAFVPCRDPRQIDPSRLQKVDSWKWQYNAINARQKCAFKLSESWNLSGVWKDYDGQHPGLSQKLESHYQFAVTDKGCERFGKMSNAFPVDGRTYDIFMSPVKGDNEDYAFIQRNGNYHRQIRRVPSNFPGDFTNYPKQFEGDAKLQVILATRLFNGPSELMAFGNFADPQMFMVFKEMVLDGISKA